VAPGFENLIAWQRARTVCAGILPIIKAASANHDFEFARQLNAAALSVVANIAEGRLRGNRRQFCYFLRIAAGSNGETRAYLYVAVDREYITGEASRPLIAATNEVGRLLQGLIAQISKSLQSQGGAVLKANPNANSNR
jgi:four helix bundle protein